MRFFKNKIFRGIIFVAALTTVLGFVASFKNNFVSNALNTVITPVQGLFASISKPISEHFTAMDELKKSKAEVERLSKENNKLKIENRDAESYIEENNRLKNLLDLRDKHVNMKTVSAKVIARDPGQWCKSVTINRGTANGIDVGDPVMTSEGILGTVDSIGLNWAKVTTIFDVSSSVGAKFTRNGDVGVVEGSQEFAAEGRCKMQYISSAASVMVGDILVTSGLGEIYPSGLMIGNVDNIKIDAMGNVEYVTVKPSADFEKVYEVLVITEFEEIEIDEQVKEEDEEDKEDEKADKDNVVGTKKEKEKDRRNR